MTYTCLNFLVAIMDVVASIGDSESRQTTPTARRLVTLDEVLTRDHPSGRLLRL